MRCRRQWRGWLQGTIGGHAEPEDQVTANHASTAREHEEQVEEGSRQDEAQVALAWCTALRTGRTLSVYLWAQLFALSAECVHVAEVYLRCVRKRGWEAGWRC